MEFQIKITVVITHLDIHVYTHSVTVYMYLYVIQGIEFGLSTNVNIFARICSIICI